jgi:phosphohistidine phosphatase
MNLYFMRHGIAVDRAETGTRSDERVWTLTPKGIKKMHKAANGLIALSLSFDRILSSLLERARQTAKIVAQALRLEERLRKLSSSLPTNRSKNFCLPWLPTRAKKILLIGHEPLLNSTVSFLLSGTAGAAIRLKKGGICCLEVKGVSPRESAVLHWALTPKQVRLLA